MMDTEEEEATRDYSVVVNHEEQYSIWPVGWPPPRGWREVGVTGPKSRCLEHIKQVWTDMRPLSLRRAMEKEGKGEQGAS